ncbi:unnamed protein product, partial [Rotaria sordida]
PKLRDTIQDRLPNADMLSSINGDEVIALGAARQCYIENKYAKVQLSTVCILLNEMNKDIQANR